MTEVSLSSPDMATALLLADHRLASAGSAAAHRVTFGASHLLEDEILVRLGAILGDLAAQALGFAGLGRDKAMVHRLGTMLAGERTIMIHCHALAIEWRLTSALAAHGRIDAVLPPILQEVLVPGGGIDEEAAIAPLLVSALTRVNDSLRRMALPWSELPGDLQHMVIALRDALLAESGMSDIAPMPWPAGHGEARLPLMQRLLGAMGYRAHEALHLDRAGVALFLTALSLSTGAPRELVALATAEDDPVRLALLLRAAGLGRDEAIAQFLVIRPDADPALVEAVEDRKSAEAILAAHGSVEQRA